MASDCNQAWNKFCHPNEFDLINGAAMARLVVVDSLASKSQISGTVVCRLGGVG